MQQHSLLATKLYIPPIRPELVSRSRLAERLKEGMTRGLTVISAPAGFGKTTLVSEWVNRLRSDAAHEGQSAHRVAWPSLDEGDNDPTRFLVYTIAALRTTEANIGKGVLSALQSCHPPPTEAVLISLINEIAATPDRIMFVLDDYHLLDADPIHDAFTFHFSTCRHRCTHYSVNHGLICENNGVILSLKKRWAWPSGKLSP